MSSKKIQFSDYEVLISPVLTEKSLSDETGSVHVFKVENMVNKKQVQRAVENIFNVKVLKVGIVNTKGKVKTFKNKIGKQKDTKKAYVRLESGCEIDYSKYNMTR